MTEITSNPGLPKAFPVEIPATWTPEQALAVFELLTDIRDRIWDVYALNIQRQIQEERGGPG